MTETALDKTDIILNAMLVQVPFEGWTGRALQLAVQSAEADGGLPKGAEHIYAPGGALGLLRLWSDRLDLQTMAEIQAMDLKSLRVRDKITDAVWARLNLLSGYEEAARRAAMRLSLPDAAAQGAEQVWSSADMIWNAIGDESEDYNYYTKRTILSGVLAASLAAWLADDSEDKSEARRFLDARINNVMQFETFKRQALGTLSGLPQPKEIFNLLKHGPKRRRSHRY